MVWRVLLILLLTWSLTGYYLLSVVNYIFEFDNTAPSVVFRASAGFSAVALIVFAGRRRLDRNLLLIIAFGTVYALQLLQTLHLRQETTALEPFEYWAWAMGASIVPAIAIYLCFSSKNADLAFKAILGTAIAATCLLLIYGSNAKFLENGMEVESGRWNIPSVNPIAMGHLAASTILLGVSSVLTSSRKRAWQFVFGGAAILAGGVLITLANSRGPAVALGISLIILVLAQFNRRGTIVLLAIVIAGVIYLLTSESENVTGGLIGRFSMVASGQDVAIELRLLAFEGAWGQFLGSPLFGDGIEERLTGFYPHNVILEALMATGLLGAIPFVLLLATALRSCWRLLRKSDGLIWLALISIQYVIAAQFSGSIYQSTAMWVTVAAVLAVATEMKVEAASLRRLRRARPSLYPSFT
jgi:O-antigen ligase